MSSRPKDFCRDCWGEWEAHVAPAVGPGDEWPMPKSKIRPLVKDSGSRCASHWREEKKRRKDANHERMVKRTYGLNSGDYGRLYLHQTGVCAICKRATGATRKLSVDHDHASGKVRGLLCRPCNDMLGHARDSYMFFYRAANYLQGPPANEVLRDE